MKSFNGYTILLFAISVLIASCSRTPQDTGRTFFTDMMDSQAYESNTTNPNFEDGRTDRVPVEGTIARGMLAEVKNNEQEACHNSYLHKRYYTNDFEGYEKAGVELKNPIELSDEVLAEGKKIYKIYCEVCHDAKGTGKGTIVETGAFPPVPNYSLLLTNKPDGKLFHAITYGKNLMGSYSAQLTVEDRWKVIYYIQNLAGVSSSSSNAANEEEINTSEN